MAMGTPCFSAAPVLRCESLSVTQYGLLIIPPGLEVLFATVLVITFWGSRGEHLFLVAEAWVYFTLVLLDSLSHMVPAARGSFSVFSNIDIALGTLSFLPLLLFMLFLYCFMRARFIIALPIRLRNLVKMVLLIFVPLIIIANEIASFIGISRQPAQDGGNTTFGFTSYNTQLLWTFFTSFTLAIFIAFQGLCFFLAFYRVVKAIVNQRNIETSAVDAVHFMRGSAWIAIGLKLGAIESIIGFAQCGFSVAIIRRLIRVISRACIILGMIKGIDAVEDFRWLEKSKRRLIRKSSEIAQIREPLDDDTRLERISTFSDEIPDVPPIPLLLVLPRNKGERVTVHYQKNQAPTLRLRFSALDLPTPSVLESNFISRQLLEGRDSENSSFPRQITATPLGSLLYPNSIRPASAQSSTDNFESTSAPRFPSLPPLAKVHETYVSPTSARTRTTFGSEAPAATPYSPIPESPTSTLLYTLHPAMVNRTSASFPPSPRPAYNERRPRLSAFGNSFLTLSRSNTEATGPPPSPYPHRRPLNPQGDASLPDVDVRSPSVYADWDQAAFSPVSDRQLTSRPVGTYQDGSQQHIRPHHELVAPRSVTISPPPQPQSYTTPPPTADTAYHLRAQLQGNPNRDLVRIKSVRRVPRMNTPVPTPVQGTRASIAVEPVLLPPQASSNIDPLAPRTDASMRYGSLIFPTPP